MRFLFLIPLLIATAAKAVSGDIISLTVRSTGWDADVVVAGLNVGGTYNFGWSGTPTCPQATNMVTGTERVKLTVSSPGYDQTGAAVTNQWTIYGTKQVRKATPSNTSIDESFDGSNVTIRIGLSDYIGPNDTITASILSGFYTQGGVPNNAAVGLTAVNNSTLPYGKVLANWAWPGWNRITTATYRARLIAFHEAAQLARPIACVKVIVRDENSHAITNTIARMSSPSLPDANAPDAVPFGEYYTDLNLSTMNDTNRLRFDFIAYPWRGTATEVLDTTANVYSLPTPYPASQTNVYDPSGHYGPTIAIVDPTAGVDANGRAVSTNTNPTLVDPNLSFSSLAKAMTLIAATNNVSFAHNDVGGGIIYLKGSTSWCSNAAASLGPRPPAWLIITNYPGSSGAISNNAIGSSSQPQMVKFDGLKINPSSANTFAVSNANWFAFWFHNCTLASAQTAHFSAGTSAGHCLTYVTDCAVTNWGQGLKFQSGSDQSFAIIRGNNLDGFTNAIQPHVFIGNKHPSTNGTTAINNSLALQFDAASMPCPPSDWALVYNNYLGGLLLGGNNLQVHQNYDVSNGVAIVQNVLEFCTNYGSSATFDFGSNNSHNYTNELIWNNAILGTKTFFGYNDTGSVAAWRVRWSVKNNIIDDFNIKSDVFTGGSGANAARIGNWALLYGCGFSGNVFLETGLGGSTQLGAPGSFLLEWCGANTISTNVVSGGNGFTNAPSYIQFFDREAYDGVSGGIFSGGGNYRLLSSSPTHNLKQEVLLPYGLNGQPRADGVPNTACFEPPGPYATGGPRKGGMFF